MIWHSWQRWGYDYRLPEIWPPNPAFGSADAFRRLAEAVKASGALFAPHDNYSDVFPEAEGFTYRNIVFQPDGQPRRAWYTAAMQAQAYRPIPEAMLPFVARNSESIRTLLTPGAYYVDVWAVQGPFDYWTIDGRFVPRAAAREAGARMFAALREAFGGAPQISESAHDQMVGILDGTQVVHRSITNWRARDTERIPWFDFAYHDKLVGLGAGYSERYGAGGDPHRDGIYSDDYIATEVLTGRPAMVAAAFGRDVVRKYWLLHDYARALAGPEKKLLTCGIAI